MRLMLCLALVACNPPVPQPVVTPNGDVGQPADQATNPDDLPEPMDRLAFNAAAVDLAVPLFWARDKDNPGFIDKGELESYLTGDDKPSELLEGEHLTDRGNKAVAGVRVYMNDGRTWDNVDEQEKTRIQAVLRELSGARATLVLTDLSDAPEADRALAKHLIAASRTIEQLFALQRGFHGMEARLTDPASRALFQRNQGPVCEGPKTMNDAACSAIAGLDVTPAGAYPADIQTKEGWCETLATNEPELLEPFVAVRRGGEGALFAVPYSKAWPEQMEAVARELEAGAAVLGDDEAALKAYLRAAAAAFRDDDWFAADAAWAAMNQDNSRWYLRVGPDETYWDPCNRKAGFHMTLARVNPASKAWQQRLEPVKADMEQALADAAGPPYVAREVGFDLPEFIDVVLNAGDARSALGATIGQSLPNWGPVADAGGRTVAMTNLFTDPDSIATKRASMESVFCPTAMETWSDDPRHLLMSTVLHEAAHNLGPSHQYRVDGKTDEEAFGGNVAAVMEELKAQSAALYLTDWLAQRHVITEEEARQTHMADIGWSFTKIATGFQTPSGKRSAYPQLAAVNLGELVDAGAVTWHPDQTAANGTDKGCMDVHHDKMAPAIAAMNSTVLQIKATADKDRAVALLDEHTAESTVHAALWKTITERMGRQPSVSFVYTVRD